MSSEESLIFRELGVDTGVSHFERNFSGFVSLETTR